MATIEEIQARRAARAAKHDDGRKAQEAVDLEAIDALEETQGEPLHTMTANRFHAGACVRVAFRAPKPVEYKRYVDMASKAGADASARLKAQTLLAESCMMYPAKDSDAFKATFEAFPGLLVSVCIEAAKVAELRAEDEGKG